MIGKLRLARSYTWRWLRWRAPLLLRPWCWVTRHRFKYSADMCLRCRKPYRGRKLT